jgi:hypothetical protein
MSGRICICLFLVNMEITIVSTSLIAITNDLGGWSKNSWVLEAYLLTYVGLSPPSSSSSSSSSSSQFPSLPPSLSPLSLYPPFLRTFGEGEDC